MSDDDRFKRIYVDARQKTGLTQPQWARLMHMGAEGGQSEISKKESGRRGVSRVDTLAASLLRCLHLWGVDLNQITFREHTNTMVFPNIPERPISVSRQEKGYIVSDARIERSETSTWVIATVRFDGRDYGFRYLGDPDGLKGFVPHDTMLPAMEWWLEMTPRNRKRLWTVILDEARYNENEQWISDPRDVPITTQWKKT